MEASTAAFRNTISSPFVLEEEMFRRRTFWWSCRRRCSCFEALELDVESSWWRLLAAVSSRWLLLAVVGC